MMRWLIYHLPDLACSMIAVVMGCPIVVEDEHGFRFCGKFPRMVADQFSSREVRRRPEHPAIGNADSRARGARIFFKGDRDPGVRSDAR